MRSLTSLMTVGKNDLNLFKCTSNKQYKPLIPQTLKVNAVLWTHTSLSSRLCRFIAPPRANTNRKTEKLVSYRTPQIYPIIETKKIIIRIKTVQPFI